MMFPEIRVDPKGLKDGQMTYYGPRILTRQPLQQQSPTLAPLLFLEV